MSSFNESAGLGLLKTDAIEFVKYPCISLVSVLLLLLLRHVFVMNKFSDNCFHCRSPVLLSLEWFQVDFFMRVTLCVKAQTAVLPEK